MNVFVRDKKSIHLTCTVIECCFARESPRSGAIKCLLIVFVIVSVVFVSCCVYASYLNSENILKTLVLYYIGISAPLFASHRIHHSFVQNREDDLAPVITHQNSNQNLSKRQNQSQALLQNLMTMSLN